MVGTSRNFCRKFLPGLNFATVLDFIFTVAPVRGFLPDLAALFDTENEPNPAMVTFPPSLSIFVTVDIKELRQQLLVL